jgi:hypothetical protein
MKKLLIALMCIAYVGTAGAQDKVKPEQTESLKNTTGPKFKFKGGDVHDFGKIPEGPVAQHIFEFTNVGKEPLIIQNASASCGCTTPEWPKEPILPGKKGKITVRYNTQGRGNQPFDKSVYITSNVTDKERYELHIKGFVTGGDQNTGKATPAAH